MTDVIEADAPLKDACVRGGKPVRAASDLPADVRARLDALFSRDALEDALEGVDPDRITGPGGLIVVEQREQALDSLGVRADARVEHLAEEGDKALVGTAHEVEALVVEDPVGIPVLRVVDRVLVDVAGGIPVAAVGRSQLRQVPEAPEEGGLLLGS